jgi:hypothetical protein
MAQVIYQYYSSGLNRNQGVINLYSDTLKLALVTSAYTPDLDAHTVWGDVSTHEVADGDGYATGGATLASKTLTRSTWKTTFDAADVTFSALTKTFRYGVIYKVGTVTDPQGGTDIVNPLYAYVLFDDTPADIAVSGTDYVVQWSSLGISQFGPSSEF